jgi:hypothetical protein
MVNEESLELDLPIPTDRSEKLDALFAALAKAQSEFTPAPKNCTNTYFNSSYADLESIVGVSRPALTKNGLAVIQLPGSLPNGKIVLKTMICHSSGQWLSSCYPILPIKMDPQIVGATFTYARRYDYSSVTGVVVEDDDGEQAHGRKSGATKDTQANKEAPKAPAPQSNLNDNPGEYVVSFGKKYMGKQLKDIPTLELESYCNWVLSENEKKGHARADLSDQVQEFLHYAEKLIYGRG